MPRVERTIIIQAPVDRVYQWWARMDNLPKVMPRLRTVKRTGPFSSRWQAEGQDGQLLEWDANIIQDIPQRQLEWESKNGPVPNKGHVDFEALSRDRTRLRIWLIESSERPMGPDGTALLATDLDATLARFQVAMEADMQVTVDVRPPSAYGHLFYGGMAATAGVLIVGALAWSLVALIEVWVIVLGALLVGATLSPAVSWLEARRLPRPVGVAITFLAVVALVTVILLVLIPTIMIQGQDLAVSLPFYVDKLQTLMTNLHEKHAIVPEGSRIMAYLAEQASGVLSNAFSITGRIVWITVVVISILFLALFILLDGGGLQRNLMKLIPLRQKFQVPALLYTVQERVGRYMLGLGAICLLAGLLTWGAMGALGVPYALLIGTVTALMQAIPFVGPLISGGLAALIGLSKSAQLAVWTIVINAIIQQIIGQLLFPVVMGRTIGMHPFWIAVALLVGGTLYGLTGAFLAIPLAIAVSIIVDCYYVPWAEARASEDERAE
ncbi:MAG: putative permease [Cyanobacteria bacterium RYN_339]|nr:putative permease [Cyanobacteria bacterium RYN_339]